MTKTNIVIASLNPVKIEAVKEAFTDMFGYPVTVRNQSFRGIDVLNFIPIVVATGVSHQPTGDKETLKGAATRALNAYKHYMYKKSAGKPPEYTVAIEGGIEFDILGCLTYAWVYIRNNKGVINYTKTTPFLLPPKVGELLAQGLELGDATDKVFNETNSKQKKGTTGILTKGDIYDVDYYVHALKLCLIPFVNEELYKKAPASVKASKPCTGCE